MALTPDDIVNYEFKQAMRGYAIPQVDDLLDRLADQVERAEREIDDLRQRLRETEARLGSTLETESTLKRTLVTAQEAAERALEDARQQADELRGAAEREVTEQLETARREAEELPVQARAEAEQLLGRAHAEAAEVTARANAQADEVTAQARSEADELMARARAEAEELSSRARDEARELSERARAEADEVTTRAQSEGEELTLRAQEAARAELFSAREERSALETRLDELREMEHRHRAILRRHLEQHMAVLDDFDELPPHRDPDEDVDPVAAAAEPSLQIRVREEDEAAYESGVPFNDAEVAAFEAADEGAASGEEVDDAGHRSAPDESMEQVDHAATDQLDVELEPQQDTDPGGHDGSATTGEEDHEGLFDHDDIDITDEVAVASPWERMAGGTGEGPELQAAPPRGDQAPASWSAPSEPVGESAPDDDVLSPWEPAPDVDDAEPAATSAEAPSPWEAPPSFPPPDASEREDAEDAEDAVADAEAGTDPAAAPQPHVRPRPDQPAPTADQDYDPYEHYDRFRDLGHNNS